MVEATGIEPVSKQSHRKLSTCLVYFEGSDEHWEQTTDVHRSCMDLRSPAQPRAIATCFVFESAAGRGNRSTGPAALMTN